MKTAAPPRSLINFIHSIPHPSIPQYQHIKSYPTMKIVALALAALSLLATESVAEKVRAESCLLLSLFTVDCLFLISYPALTHIIHRLLPTSNQQRHLRYTSAEFIKTGSGDTFEECVLDCADGVTSASDDKDVEKDADECIAECKDIFPSTLRSAEETECLDKCPRGE